MSMCSGKTLCDIYRDKKYCRKVEEKQNDRGICNCRHAALTCEVGRCVMEEFCGAKNAPSLADLIRERIGGKHAD